MPDRRGALTALGVMLATGAGLLAMGRTPICKCGTVKLWWGVVQSSENSQHLSDWYSASHLIHGLLFYFFAWLLWRKWKLFGGKPVSWALPIAVAFESFWELLENSPVIIDRYRAVTVSYGYEGDSVINSLSDISFMVFGFWLASKLPPWGSVALAVFLELFTLYFIRDNLTLNVLMLVWPLETVRQWQAGA
ncbi:MAG: DUF2585 domain-containing protein [Sphingomonadales bacterium]|nr:DUF2585 domain-containing protein [Sphingomonadales bacterium]